jgi:hypothetical protein
MRRLWTVSLTITLVAFSGPVLAARTCKDGFIVYTGSAAAPTRALAEASAPRLARRTEFRVTPIQTFEIGDDLRTRKRKPLLAMPHARRPL